jgi:hypothetical protein
MLFDFFDGGADSENALADNRAALDARRPSAQPQSTLTAAAKKHASMNSRGETILRETPYLS